MHDTFTPNSLQTQTQIHASPPSPTNGSKQGHVVKSSNPHRPCQISRSVLRTAEKTISPVRSSTKNESTAHEASRSSSGQISTPLRSGHSTLSFLAQIRATPIPNPTPHASSLSLQN
ncbi:hypothetical protein RIF29_41554 [Crotalaria pallida]|uniref:Uncharacterized protein n=1 Tax=Crotalaria pallida TaxID=3830 RepID=A0AAN9E5M7_CROPI